MQNTPSLKVILGVTRVVLFKLFPERVAIIIQETPLRHGMEHAEGVAAGKLRVPDVECRTITIIVTIARACYVVFLVSGHLSMSDR